MDFIDALGKVCDTVDVINTIIMPEEQRKLKEKEELEEYREIKRKIKERDKLVRQSRYGKSLEDIVYENGDINSEYEDLYERYVELHDTHQELISNLKNALNNGNPDLVIKIITNL